jgi:membrane fusion protein (multidrug efflux system)
MQLYLTLYWRLKMIVLNMQRARSIVLNLETLSAFAGLLTLGMVSMTGCEKSDVSASSGAPQAMKVSVVKAEQGDVPVTGEWVGTLDGYVNAQIQPQASGYLIRQNYREGSEVQKDQVLFEIDPRPFEAGLQQAQGQLEQAQAQLGLAQINVGRDTPLAAARAIAKSQLDNEKQQESQAQAGVKSAQAAVATAKLNLSFTQVRSLITGVAGQATTQVGNLVSGQSVLTSVSQLDPIKVYFSISDSEYLAFAHKARGASKIPLTLTLSNGDVYPLKGHIAFVDRQLNAQTGAIRIAASFPNPGNFLRPGQFGRVRAETEIRHNAILVPQTAVTEFQGMQQVYTVAANNTVHANNVTLGPQYGDNLIIESGITGGSYVITDNLQKLREGATVDPQPAKSLPSAPSQSLKSPGGI